MTEKTSISRKKVFVDKRFQFRFILNFVLLIIVGTIVFNLAAYFILDKACGESLFSAHLAISSTGDLLLPTLTYLSIAFILILALASAVITLLLSHRISGPLFAIVRYLNMVSGGRLDFEAKLRTKDQTGVLADTLTETIKSLGGRINMTKDSLENLKMDLAQLDEYIKQEEMGHGEMAKYFHDLKEHLRILEDRIGFFQTK